MSISCCPSRALAAVVSLVSTLALGATHAAAQCTERYQRYTEGPTQPVDFGWGNGEEFGLRVQGIPAAHFPIEIVALGMDWHAISGLTTQGSVRVYPTGTPASFETPLYTHLGATASQGENDFDVTSSGPFVLSSQPFVVTWRYEEGPWGNPGGDDDGAQRGDNLFHFVAHPGPGWFDVDGLDFALWIEYVPAAVGASFCLGDGSQGDCPCGAGQNGAPGEGCQHSFGSGGRLAARGEASVAADTLSLAGSGLPPSTTVLFFQYLTSASPATFGDGLVCTGGAVRRLRAAIAQGGAACAGSATGHSLAALGAIAPSGGSAHYQAWFRNQQAFCTPAVFNVTAGVTIDWTP